MHDVRSRRHSPRTCYLDPHRGRPPVTSLPPLSVLPRLKPSPGRRGRQPTFRLSKLQPTARRGKSIDCPGIIIIPAHHTPLGDHGNRPTRHSRSSTLPASLVIFRGTHARVPTPPIRQRYDTLLCYTTGLAPVPPHRHSLTSKATPLCDAAEAMLPPWLPCTRTHLCALGSEGPCDSRPLTSCNGGRL